MQSKARGAYLMAELVAGHSQDNEPLASVALVELVHLGVIPGGRTSERRDVLNEDHLAPQAGEIERFSRQQVCWEVVEISRHIALPTQRPLLPSKLLERFLASPWFLPQWRSKDALSICQENSHPAPLPLGRPTSNVTGKARGQAKTQHRNTSIMLQLKSDKASFVVVTLN